MEKQKVRFTEEKATMLATLYGHALDSRSPDSILGDIAADESVQNIAEAQCSCCTGQVFVAGDTRRSTMRSWIVPEVQCKDTPKEKNVARISPTNDVVTLINVFTVKPEDQQRLVDVLVEATQTTMNKLSGFVSANIHKSLDGTRVVNYAQWESRETLEAMFENPEAMSHMREAGQIAEKFEPYLYKVAFVDEATPS